MNIFRTTPIGKAGKYLLSTGVSSGLYLAFTIAIIGTIFFVSFMTLSFLGSTFDKVLFTSEEAGASISSFNLTLFETLAPRFEIPIPGATPSSTQKPATTSREQTYATSTAEQASSTNAGVDN